MVPIKRLLISTEMFLNTKYSFRVFVINFIIVFFLALHSSHLKKCSEEHELPFYTEVKIDYYFILTLLIKLFLVIIKFCLIYSV